VIRLISLLSAITLWIAQTPSLPIPDTKLTVGAFGAMTDDEKRAAISEMVGRTKLRLLAKTDAKGQPKSPTAYDDDRSFVANLAQALFTMDKDDAAANPPRHPVGF
jgi:hypothetical protein